MVVSPYVQIQIDFNEDGKFLSGSDVTDDVRYWSVDRGVDPAMHRAPAAVLRLELNNFDHKYSPANTASPLYPFTLPGPLIRVRAGYPADVFAVPNDTVLDGRTPDLAGSELGTWTATSGMTIQNDAVEIDNTGTFIATLDYGEPNVRLAAQVRRPLTATNPHKMPIFCFRYADANNFAYISYEGTSSVAPVFWRLHEVIGGVDTQRDSVQAPGVGGWEPDDYADLECKVVGGTVEIYYRGTTAGGAQLRGLTQLTNTRHGIGGPGFTADNENGGVTWDDFGLLTKFYGRVDAVDPQTSHEDKLAYIRAYDDMERLRATVLYTGTPDLPADAGDIAARILSRADFENGWLLDSGTTLTPAAASGSQDTRKVIAGLALDELYQLAEDEVGLFYLDAAGVAHLEAADHRENNDHAAAIATWGDNSTYDKKWLPPFIWDDGIEGVENQIFYHYYRSSKTASQTVWQLQDGDDPQFDFVNRPHPDIGSHSIVDIVTVGDGDAIAAPKIPAPVTDYSIDENADGSGVEWTAVLDDNQGTVSMLNIPGSNVSLDDTGQNFVDSTEVAGLNYDHRSVFIVIVDDSGNRAIARMLVTNPDSDGTRVALIDENGDPGFLASDEDFDHSDTPLTYSLHLGVAYPLPGFEGNYQFLRFVMPDTITLVGSTATTAFVTDAQLTADRVEGSDPAVARAEDTDSIGTYGIRRVQLETKHIADWNTAMGRAEKRLQLRKDARERVTVNMQSASVLNLMEIRYRDVSDRIRVIHDDMGVDRDHFIENYLMEAHADWGGLIKMKWELTRVVVGGGLNYLWDDAPTLWDTFTWAAPA